MKKFAILLLVHLFFFHLSFMQVQAEKHSRDSKGMEQAMDHFVLALLNEELSRAVHDFYKKDTLIQYNWWAKDYDVVEIEQWEKGNELSHPFIIKLTVLPYDKNESRQLGVDTITFGISPQALNTQKNNKSLASTEVDLLDYKHSEVRTEGR